MAESETTLRSCAARPRPPICLIAKGEAKPDLPAFPHALVHYRRVRIMAILLATFVLMSFHPMVLGAAGDPSLPTAAASAASSGSQPTWTRTVLLSGLNAPWDLAFTPDGAMLYTEKCRGLSVRHPDGSRRRLFGVAGSVFVAGDFFCQGQSGMLGVAVDPEFDPDPGRTKSNTGRLRDPGRSVPGSSGSGSDQVKYWI